MGISSEMRDSWAKRRESLLIASALEEDRIRKSRECTQGVSTYVAGTLQNADGRLSDPPKVEHFGGFDTAASTFLESLKGVRAGTKAAAVACVASAIPTLVAVRTIPWAKANLNYTAQALIISAASIAAYFITAEKTILECARRNTHYDKSA